MIRANHAAEVDRYIDGVLSGKITAGRLVQLAVQRHVDDLDSADGRGFYHDPTDAEFVIDFCGHCNHSKGEWARTPFLPSPWQKFCMWAVFGWKKIETDKRRFRRAHLSVARKNGKSTWVAALGHYGLVADREEGSEVYVGATRFDQACIVHDESVRMREQSPSLKSLEQYHKTKHNLSVAATNSFYRPIGSDKAFDGLNPHVVIKDEMHAMREHHRDFHNTLSTGGAARTQPLELVITTAGDDKSTIWQEEDDYARRVLESVETGDIVDDSVFAFIACIDKEDDPYDESCWIKANPNLGVSVSLDYLRQQCNEARQKPSADNAWRRYHCNIQTTSTERLIMPRDWLACQGELAV